MKLQSIYASNFLGVAAVELRLPEPVQLFAGRNGAGKSSLRDAIALALTADLGRVSLKKDAAQLIRTGADGACCEVGTADDETYSVTISAAGKIGDSQKGREADPALAYVLDAQRFARLDATERRAFLYGLMGVKTGQAEIATKLKARGCDDAKVQRVLPLLRAGFDAACKQAKANATEAKGAWRAITGETYGSEKAKAWRAAVPAYDAEAAKQTATELQHCDLAMGQWQQQVGKQQAEEQRRAGLRSKVPALREHAAKIERIQAKLVTDEQQLAEWEADLKKTAAAAGVGPRVGLVHDLAEQMSAMLLHGERCSWFADRGDQALVKEAQQLLDRYELEHGEIGVTGGDEQAREQLPSIKRSRDLLASAVSNDKRDLEGAQLAKSTADDIEVELAEAFDAAALADAHDQVEKLKAQRAELVKKADAFKTLKAAGDSAERRTKEAAQHAADVAAWDAMGDALSPNGIPAEILGETLGPINDRLRQSSEDTGWMHVVISPEMAIACHGRDYRLLSESERWRVDAMLAEAIAHLSGTRLLVLDRFDVLDLQGRGELLSWLDVLASEGEIDTALIFGTLKALPTGLPTTIAAHWIENGVVAQLKQAA